MISYADLNDSFLKSMAEEATFYRHKYGYVEFYELDCMFLMGEMIDVLEK